MALSRKTFQLVGDLPFPFERVLLGLEIEAMGRDELRQPADPVEEAGRVAVDVDPDHGPPDGGLDGDQPELGGIELELRLGPRCSPQAAVEVVRPAVVHALEGPAVARLVDDDVRAVAADVDEAADLSVLARDQHHGHARHLAERLVARL